MKKISIVIPVYNEEEIIEECYKRIKNVADENNKNAIFMLIDMLVWYVFYGSTLTDYLNYEFYKDGQLNFEF